MNKMSVSPLLLFVLLVCLLSACQPVSTPAAQWQTIAARYDEHLQARLILYRALVPLTWLRRESTCDKLTADTMQPICEFHIEEKGRVIRITLHTFAIASDGSRIPPQAQIFRWKQQIDQMDPCSICQYSESHGGFSGDYLECQGLVKGAPTAFIACSMQLADVYVQQLDRCPHSVEWTKRADYTLKAAGPPDLMAQHRLEILGFMRSLELIDELPAPRFSL